MHVSYGRRDEKDARDAKVRKDLPAASKDSSVFFLFKMSVSACQDGHFKKKKYDWREFD